MTRAGLSPNFLGGVQHSPVFNVSFSSTFERAVCIHVLEGVGKDRCAICFEMSAVSMPEMALRNSKCVGKVQVSDRLIQQNIAAQCPDN